MKPQTHPSLKSLCAACVLAWASCSPAIALTSQGHTGAFFYAETVAGNWDRLTLNVDLAQATVLGVSGNRPVPYVFLGAHDHTGGTNAEAGLYWRAGAWHPFSYGGGGWFEPAGGVSIPATSSVQLEFGVESNALRLTVRDWSEGTTLVHTATEPGYGAGHDLRFYRQVAMAVDPGQEDFGDGALFSLATADPHLYSPTGFAAWSDSLTAVAGVYPEAEVVTVLSAGLGEVVTINHGRAIPEPSSWLLLVMGCAGVAMCVVFASKEQAK